MKNLLLFLLLLFCFCIKAQYFEGGLIGGITGSQIEGDGYSGFNKAGIDLGAYVRRDFSKKSSFQLEIKYEGKGAAAQFVYDPNSQTNPDPYSMGLHYIEIPVTYIYKFHPKFSFYFGLEAGYLFYQYGRDQQGYSYQVHIYKDYEIAGIGGLYYYLNKKYRVGLRYSYSITPIFSTIGGYSTWFYYRYSYNNNISLCVYYTLGR